MKHLSPILLLSLLLAAGCTSQEKLAYLNNLPEPSGEEKFPYYIPDYKVEYKDILYISVKTFTSEGKLTDVYQAGGQANQSSQVMEESQYLIGYNVDIEGNILLPVIGKIRVGGMTLPVIRDIVQQRVDSVFNHAYAEVKLLSFRYTVLGEARNPGSFVNYNDYLTIFDALGKAGGVGDFGRRDRVLVVRSTKDETHTYRLNLQDKNLLSSEAFFLQPNDVVIIEATKQKVFNQNIPTISFILTTFLGTLSTTLLLINYFE
jgi:polysaccharide export outer membrane protein